MSATVFVVIKDGIMTEVLNRSTLSVDALYIDTHEPTLVRFMNSDKEYRAVCTSCIESTIESFNIEQLFTDNSTGCCEVCMTGYGPTLADPLQLRKLSDTCILLALDDDADREAIKKELQEHGELEALAYLFDPLVANSDMDWISADEIGALTDAPMVGYGVQRDDDGKLVSYDHVIMDQSHAVRSTVEGLLSGEVVQWFIYKPE